MIIKGTIFLLMNYLKVILFGASDQKVLDIIVGGVKYDPPVGICSTHPHNFLIQIISETGLIGLIFYLSSLIFVILKLMKIYHSQNIIYDKNCFVIISLGLIVNFFPFVPNGNFFNNWISIINFYYIGLYLFSYKKIFNL